MKSLTVFIFAWFLAALYLGVGADFFNRFLHIIGGL